ncbi:MtrAB system histidine kinase MtrB [Devriesea agamarum]|uniref:MtrAB system histidine kinase MtrB n=1 Tax=Devriesea agamarum TaxID=472569 RepID=UPI00071CA4D5|nr:MtrAB system histidine kinase MtrB [Devriesea agamarum]
MIAPRSWSLTVRVVVVTVVLATVGVLTVGLYLSSVIADGVFEQRSSRILAEAQDTRRGLMGAMDAARNGTTIQQQDTATRFVQSLRTFDEGAQRQAALVPADPESSLSMVTTDRTMLSSVSPELHRKVASGDGVYWQSVALADDGRTVPGIIVGTRVTVPGAGSYDLYLRYSLSNEQNTLEFVQHTLIGAGAALLVLLAGIAVVVARMVTNPLRRAAAAAERLAQGDLSSRMEVSGADELGRVGTSFNHMAASLQEKVEGLAELSRLQHRFVSDVSHELRTPLTTIRMAAAVLDDVKSSFPPDVRRTSELMTTQVRRFDSLLADLLEISRFDAGAAVLDARSEDLGEVVDLAVLDASPIARERGTRLEVRCLADDVTAVVDARRIGRIFRNLITNAIEHGAGKPVLIEIGADAQAVAVVVQDFGQGLTPEAAERVFDRFWRADPSRARTLGGTGLGLAISLEDAHLHAGWLQAWGQEGLGAVFRLTLPRRPGTTLASSPLPLHRDLNMETWISAATGSLGPARAHCDSCASSGDRARLPGPADLPADLAGSDSHLAAEGTGAAKPAECNDYIDQSGVMDNDRAPGQVNLGDRTGTVTDEDEALGVQPEHDEHREAEGRHE